MAAFMPNVNHMNYHIKNKNLNIFPCLSTIIITTGGIQCAECKKHYLRYKIASTPENARNKVQFGSAKANNPAEYSIKNALQPFNGDGSLAN